MKNRLADGWTIDQLWDRLQAAEMGDGFSYEYAETVVEPPVLVDVVED